MSNVWFTSDLHIGHETVARQRTRGWVLPRYVGAEIDAHDRVLAEKWDALVRPDDIVWVLGDISAGGNAAQRKALRWITQRPGWKHLITGEISRHNQYRLRNEGNTPQIHVGVDAWALQPASLAQIEALVTA